VSPEQVSILTTLLAILKALSGWPFALLFFGLVIGPWVLATFLAWSYRKRFEAVVDMYESNVRLVEKYEQTASDLKDVIILNTQTMTTLVEKIRNWRT